MLLFIMLLAIGTGCKDPITPVPIKPTPQSPCSDTLKELKYVWQIPMTKDTLRRGTADILCYDDKVTAYIEDENGILSQFNAKTGKSDWKWQSPSLSETISGDLAMYYRNGIISLGILHAISTVNTSTGNLIKKQPSPNGLKGDIRFASFGNYLYQDFGYVDQFTDTTTYFMRADINTLKWDTLLTLRRKDHSGYMGHVEPGALYTTKQSDSLILFKFRTVIHSTSRCFFYAYNVNKRQVQWRIDSLDADGNIYPPIVEGNKCYVQGQGTIYCINADNGQIIWERWCGGAFAGGSNLISYQDRLAAVTLDGRFVCINKATGEFFLERKDAVGKLFDLASPSAAVEYNGVMYVMGGGFFYGIDLLTFNVLGKYQTPNRCKYSSAIFGYGAIGVNRQLGYIFIDDQFFLMAIKAFK